MLIERAGFRRMRGFSLVEVIVAIVIIGVGLAGVLSVFNVNVRNSADPVVRKQLMAIAEQLIEEISLRPFANGPSPGAAAVGGCRRDAFDGLDDYNGYPANGQVCDGNGTAIAGLAGYRLAVTVTQPAAAAAAVVMPGVPAARVRRIQVAASLGAEQVVLVAWRTEYARP